MKDLIQQLESMKDITEDGHYKPKEIISLIDHIEDLILEEQDRIVARMSKESIPKDIQKGGGLVFDLFVSLDKAVRIVKGELR